MNPNLPLAVQYIQALGPAFVAGVALVITVVIQARMLSVARQKNKMELFDRRYELYEKARMFISVVLSQGENYNERSFNGFKELHAARFLFKPEVYGLLLEIAQLGDAIYFANEVEWKSAEAEKAKKERLEARKKLIEYSNTLHEKFNPYMTLGRVTD